MEAAQQEYARFDANNAHARECARLDAEAWAADGDAEYEAWLDGLGADRDAA